MNEHSHDRGTYVHPEDGKTYTHPSSLDQPHHIHIDGCVVYSPAQKAALVAAAEIDARQAAEAVAEAPLPAFVYHGINADDGDAQAAFTDSPAQDSPPATATEEA